MNNDEDYNSSGKDVRKGKWTVEEENYSNKIISMFNQGLLFIPAGTTLRSYLSEKLSCDPMRITKKFAGASCIGKQVFHPCEHTEANNQLRKEGMAELQQLEYAFLHRLRSKSAAVAQLVEKFVPSQSPGGGRGVKNKHNPSISGSSGMTLEKSNSFTLSNDVDRLRTTSSESGGYLVVKEEGVGLDSDAQTFQKNKRIMSAPDLTMLLSNEGLTASDSSTKLSELAYSPGSSFLLGSNSGKKVTPRGRVRTGSGAKMSRELSDSFNGGVGIASAHHNSLRMSKKYYSQMDLAHYEKLATDDMAAGNLFLNFMQTLGDKYHTNPHVSKSPSVDQLNLLSQVSAAATASAHHSSSSGVASGAEAFMTIDDVISSTVTQDFSSFHVSDVKVPSPFNNFSSSVNQATNNTNTSNSSRCVSVLSSHSPLLLSNPDLVSLNPIMITTKEVLAVSHTSVQGIEHLDAAFVHKNSTTTSGSSSSGGVVLESAPIFVDQSQSAASNTVESAGGFEDSNFF